MTHLWANACYLGLSPLRSVNKIQCVSKRTVCLSPCKTAVKEVSGLEWYLWGMGFLFCLALSMVLLAKAVQTIPIGTAYPVWTGIGAVGTVILGIVFFHEPASFLRLFFITTLIGSIVGLKMVSH